MPSGRPSTFNEAIAELICQRVAAGDSLREVMRDEGLDRHTVWRWLGKHESFRSQYEIAQRERAEYYAESLVDIADADAPLDVHGKMDPAWVAQQRLRVDARKWLASKILPKKYGERVQAEVTGQINYVAEVPPRSKTPEEWERNQ